MPPVIIGAAVFGIAARRRRGAAEQESSPVCACHPECGRLAFEEGGFCTECSIRRESRILPCYPEGREPTFAERHFAGL